MRETAPQGAKHPPDESVKLGASRTYAQVDFGATEEVTEESREAELILTAFRTLILLVIFVAPVLQGLSPNYETREIALAALAGIYNIAMGVACLSPGRYGVRRPFVLAMDTMLITVWIHFSGRWELASFYYVVVVVAAMWFRVGGGVVAAAVCDFLFLFLWGRMAGDARTLSPPPFTFSMAINTALLFMVGGLAGYISEAQERERNRRLERELLIANYQQEFDVSRQLQPLLVSRLNRSHSGLEVGGAIKTARQMGGGDYVDALPLPDGRTLLCIADVSGKSVRAQARVPLLKYSLRALAPLHPDLGELVDKLQETLAPDLQPDLYIALCLIVLEKDSEELTWCNAGHMAPYLVKPSAGQEAPVLLSLETTTPALGLFPDVAPQVRKAEFAAGDTLLLFTDGLADALSFGGTEDGENQVRILAARLGMDNCPTAAEAAQEMVDLACSVLDDKPFFARHFLMGDKPRDVAPHRDDIAVLVVRSTSSAAARQGCPDTQDRAVA